MDARPGHSALFLVPFLALSACLTRGFAGDQRRRGAASAAVVSSGGRRRRLRSSLRLLFARSAVNVCGGPNGCVLQRRVG